MQTSIGIRKEDMAKSAGLLNIFLADEFLLYTKTKNANWNIEGADFFEKHGFFEKQFEELDEIMDAVAERIRTLGHYAPATLKRFLQLTHISEVSDRTTESKGFIKDLLTDHESIIVHYRAAISQFSELFHDEGTSDFITGMLQKHEKMACMLRQQLN